MSTVIGTLHVRMGAEIAPFTRALDQANQHAKTFADRMEGIGRTLSLGVTTPLVGLGAAAVRTATQFDSLMRGLAAVSGGTAEAARQFDRLREVAKLPGLGLQEALRGATSLQAAGFSADLAERALKAFGNALATVGRGKVELDGVIFALGQIQAKGKVSAEEINQLAERLPQIRRAMQGAFGTANTEALQKMGLDATRFIEAIVREFEKLPGVTGGAQNAFENLGDTVTISLNRLSGDKLNAVTAGVNKLASAIEGATGGFLSLSPATQRSVLVLGGIAAAAGPAALALGSMTRAYATLSTAAAASGALQGMRSFVALLPAIRSTTDAVTLLGFATRGALGFLTGPAGIAIAAFGAASAFTAYKVRAELAEAATNRFRDSLKGLSRDALLLETAGIFAQIEVLKAERARLAAANTGRPGQIGKIDVEVFRLELRAQEAARRFNSFSTTGPATPPPVIANTTSALETLQERVGMVSDAFSALWQRRDPRAAALLAELTAALASAERTIATPNVDLKQLTRALSLAEQIRETLERTIQVDVQVVQPRNLPPLNLRPVPVPNVSLPAGVKTGPLEKLLGRIGDFAGNAQVIEGAADGVLSLGRALGTLSDSAGRALDGISSAARGVQTIQASQSLSGAAQVAGMVGGMAGIIGGVVGTLGALFAKSPGQEARDALLKANNRELEKLRLSLQGFVVSADAMGRAAQAAAKLGTYNWGEMWINREAVLQRFGLTMGQLRQIADQLGIRLDGSAKSFEQLAVALDYSLDTLTRFGDSLDQQRRLQTLKADLFDLPTGAAETIGRELKLLEQMAPDLARKFGLAGLMDDGEVSAADRAAIEQGLRNLFSAIEGKILDPKLLGGLTGLEDLLSIITGVEGGLDELGKAAEKAAGALSNVPEIFDYALRRRMAALDGLQAPGSGIRMPDYEPRPSEPGGGGRGVTLHIDPGAIVVQGATDPAETARQVRRELVRSIRQSVGADELAVALREYAR